MGKKEKKKTKEKRKSIVATTTCVILIILILCGLFGWYQIHNVEAGILDVCAIQQDTYVQLVLEQINLKDNRDNEEIINNILSTLDASSNKYWTFSKDKSMLFVKDVMETNRYKGLTTASYYNSESAKKFLDSLTGDRVIHRNIIVNDKDYIASGVVFEYNNEEYRLCLLTNKSVIMSNNMFMSAKIEMMILVGFLMIVLLSVSVLFACKLERLMSTKSEQNKTIIKLQGVVGQLNELLSKKDHYDTRYQIWNKETLKDFLLKLSQKNVDKVVAAKLHFASLELRSTFFDKASVLLDKKVLRFSLNENEIILIFIQYDAFVTKSALSKFLDKGMVIKEIKNVSLDMDGIDKYISALEEEVDNGYKNI